MKKVIIFAAILLSCSTGMQAQTEDGDNDDVITVTDKEGKAEEIEVPRFGGQSRQPAPSLQCSDIYDAGYSMQLQG